MLFRALRASTRRSRSFPSIQWKNKLSYNVSRTIHARDDKSSTALVQQEPESKKTEFTRLKDAKVFLELVQLRQSQDYRTCKELKELVQDRAEIDQGLLLYLSQSAIANNMPRLLLPFFHIAFKLGVQIDTPFYETVFQQLVQARQWSYLQTLLDTCKWKKVPYSPKLFDTQLRVWLHQEKYQQLSLESVQAHAKYLRVGLDQESYHILIEASIANQDMEHCREVIIQMEAVGFPVNQETYRAILARMVSIGPNEPIETRALRALQGTQGPLHDAVINSLIRLRSIAGDDTALRKHISLLQQSSTARQEGDSPLDVTTIAVLMEHFARRKNLDGARKLFNLIKELNLGYTPEVIAHMITVYGQCEQYEAVYDLFARLLLQLPSSQKRRAFQLLRRFGWQRHPGDLKKLEPINVYPSVYIVNAIGNVMLKKYGFTAVFGLLDLMEVIQVPPDDDTARRILHHLNRFQDTDSNVLIAILYRLMSYTGLAGRMRLANIAFHSLLKEHKRIATSRKGWKASATALSLSDLSTPEHGQSGSSRIVHAFRGLEEVNGYERLNSPQLRVILSSVSDSNARQDHATYSLRMFYYARVEKDVGMVEALYERMLELNLQPNAYHIAALIDAYLLTNQIDKARDMLAHASTENTKSHSILYTMIICAYGDLGEPEKGLALYRKMLEDEVKPDIASMDAVIRGFFMVKEYNVARTLLHELWTTVLPWATQPDPHTPLKESLRILRHQEKLLNPDPPTDLPSEDVVQGVVQRWRRAAKKDRKARGRPPQLAPTARHLESILNISRAQKE